MTWQPDPDRAYRVAYLRADEAKHLSDRGENQRHDCCPHLRCLHEGGTRDDGSTWEFCLLCDCEDSTPVPARRISDENYRRSMIRAHLRWTAIRVAFWFTCLGFIVGWLVFR